MPFNYFYGKRGGQCAFYRIPKLLFTDSRFETLSTDAKLLYGMLIDRMQLSLLAELDGAKGIGLIESVRQGMEKMQKEKILDILIKTRTQDKRRSCRI